MQILGMNFEKEKKLKERLEKIHSMEQEVLKKEKKIKEKKEETAKLLKFMLSKVDAL